MIYILRQIQTVYETLRKFAKTIQIITLRYNYTSFHIDWDKQTNNNKLNLLRDIV